MPRGEGVGAGHAAASSPRILRSFALAALDGGRVAECPRDVDPTDWALVVGELAHARGWCVRFSIDPDTSRWIARRTEERGLDRELREP